MKMKKSTLIHLPLQYFAEPGTSADVIEGASSEDGGNPPAQPTFDEMLKDKAYQAEFDRRMSKAIDTAKAKWDKEAEEKADEAAKLAKMTADEKAKHESEKREKALADREAAVAKRELTAEAISQLTEKGLPAELAKCLDYTSAESCEASFGAVVSAFNTAVEKQVNDKLRGGTPPAAPAQSGSTTTFGSIADALRAEATKKN